jgi:transposase
MGKRKWTDMQAVESAIIKMRAQGMSRTQIAEELGLERKQIDNWITRYNKKKSAIKNFHLKPLIVSPFSQEKLRSTSTSTKRTSAKS